MRSSLALRTVLAWLAGVAALAAWLALAAATAAPPVRSVEGLDVQRYAGTWYEVARLPHRRQARCVGDATATYWPLEARSLRLVRECRDASDRWAVTVAEAVADADDAGGGRFALSVLPAWLRWWPRSSEAHWVVLLDRDYRWAVVSEPSRRSLWILSRTPALAPELYGEVVAQLRAGRYPVERLVPTPHRAEGHGRPAGTRPISTAGRIGLTV